MKLEIRGKRRGGADEDEETGPGGIRRGNQEVRVGIEEMYRKRSMRWEKEESALRDQSLRE